MYRTKKLCSFPRRNRFLQLLVIASVTIFGSEFLSLQRAQATEANLLYWPSQMQEQARGLWDVGGWWASPRTLPCHATSHPSPLASGSTLSDSFRTAAACITFSPMPSTILLHPEKSPIYILNMSPNCSSQTIGHLVWLGPNNNICLKMVEIRYTIFLEES